MSDEENPNAKLMAALLERMEAMEKKAAKKKADKQQRRLEKEQRRAEEAERQRAVNEELERQRLDIAAPWESDRAKFEEALGKAAQRIEELEKETSSEDSPVLKRRDTHGTRVSFSTLPPTPTLPPPNGNIGAVTPMTAPKEIRIGQVVPKTRSDRRESRIWSKEEQEEHEEAEEMVPSMTTFRSEGHIGVDSDELPPLREPQVGLPWGRKPQKKDLPKDLVIRDSDVRYPRSITMQLEPTQECV